MTTMLQARRPRAKSAKPVSYAYFPSMAGIGTIEISRGELMESYTVRETRVDPGYCDGRGFRLTKDRDGRQYDCLVATDQHWDSCDCADKTYSLTEGHRCKHMIACRAVVESGEIDLEDPDMARPCSPTAPAPAQEAKPVAGGPSEPLTTICGVCGEIAELRPVRHRRYSHEPHCSTCLDRAERLFQDMHDDAPDVGETWLDDPVCRICGTGTDGRSVHEDCLRKKGWAA